jgi:hypothetical protein
VAEICCISTLKAWEERPRAVYRRRKHPTTGGFSQRAVRAASAAAGDGLAPSGYEKLAGQDMKFSLLFKLSPYRKFGDVLIVQRWSSDFFNFIETHFNGSPFTENRGNNFKGSFLFIDADNLSRKQLERA